MLLTIDRFKELNPDLKIDDSILANMLRAVESLIRCYTHNDFQVRSVRSLSESLNNRILYPPQHLAVGDTIQISGSLLNNGIYTVTEISGNSMTVDSDLLDCRKNLVTKINYPPDVIMGAVNMLKWDAENRSKIGIQSETISRHSVTYFNMDGDNTIMGYPRSLLGFLKPYMKARF